LKKKRNVERKLRSEEALFDACTAAFERGFRAHGRER
jgi:hypothetical protein